MEEIWKDIPNYEGYYQVSNLSRIKGLERTIIRGGKVTKWKERILMQTLSKGYYTVVLSKGRKHTYTVHRLVCKAFIPNPDNKKEVNHKNCIKSDNRLENMEWCTRAENAYHAGVNNLITVPSSGDHYTSKGYLNTETGVYYDCGVEAYHSTAKRNSLANFMQMTNGRLSNRTKFIRI